MPQTLLDWLPNPWLAILVGGAGIFGFITFNGLFLIWLERKVSARIQRRLGPTEVGYAGTLQTLADVGKLIGKELINPRAIDPPLFHAAPVIVFVPVILGLALFPIDRNWSVTNVNVGLVLVFTMAALAVLGFFMAGWGSNNKYALLGAMRSVSQNIAYEIPLILTALTVAMIAGSMNLREIAEAQSTVWFGFVQPVGALIYFVSSVAETNRAPFDIPEAESELVAGFHTEYSGMRFAIFFLAEYTNMVIAAMVATTLFLGGYAGPVLPGFVWFFLKVYFLIFVMMWWRWTFPRIRFDQLMNLAWAVLLPLAIGNLLITAVVLKLL